MAGIGFELQRSLDRGTYTSYLQAYFTAVAYSSGPWICTLLALVLITGLARPALGVAPVAQFTSVLVYVYAASLLISGPIQLLLTRYVADCLFSEDRDGVLTGVADALGLAALLAGVAGYAIFSTAGADLPVLAVGTGLLVVVTCLWIVMAYLTAVKRFRAVTTIFLAGAVASVLFAIGLARHAGMGTLGLLLGYGLGHAAMLACLVSVSTWEFRFERRSSWNFFRYFKEMPGLVFAGLLMNLALWTDKFLVWGIRGVEEVPGFYSRWQYDIPAYLAYLSVLPSQAFFLIKVETRFEERYQRFLTSVLESPAEVVLRRKEEMNEALRDGLAQLLKFQGVLSLVVLLVAPQLLIALRLHTLDLVLLEMLLLGAYCHFGMLHVLVFLMYLDRRREIVAILTIFCILTGVGTTLGLLASVQPSPLWAAGYTLAGAVGLLLAIQRVLALGSRIDYLLLFRQELRGADQQLITFRPAADVEDVGTSPA